MKNILTITSLLVFMIMLSNCKKCEYISDCENCPAGFIKNTTNNNCENIEIENAIFNGTLFNIEKGDINTLYSGDGANFYDTSPTTAYPINSSTTGASLIDSNTTPLTFTTSASTALFWLDRLNTSGVWASGVSFNQWVGFSTCITVEQDTKVCIGLGADNQIRFDINPAPLKPRLVELNNTNTFNYRTWHVFEYTLLAGDNIIEIEGLDDGIANRSFGAEIYRGSLIDLNSWTTVNQLEDALIYSTVDQLGSLNQIGVSNGYSCPNGGGVDFCSGDSIPICRTIQRVNFLPCKEVIID